MDAFSARLNAAEGTFFRTEQKTATERHLQKLVDEGKLPQTALRTLGEPMRVPQGLLPEIPVTVINAKPASEVVFKYNGTPIPRISATESWARFGTSKVSLGRARWNSDGASIFSVQDGKRLAQTPVKQPTPWELQRMRKVAEASVDKRVVSGVRLMPDYTPARAMLWGSILALWGTAAVVATMARRLDIHTKEEAADKLRDAVAPYVGSSRAFFEPVRSWFGAQDASAGLASSLLPARELARQMRQKLGHEQHA